MPSVHYGPSTYGDHFADVYDDWYADMGDPASVVGFVSGLSAPPGDVVELGAGTGRLALPLAQAGYRVTALEVSRPMLDALDRRLAVADDEVARRVVHHQVDLAATATGDLGRHHVALAAFNLLFLLPDRDSQARCLRTAAGALHDEGVLVLECGVPSLPATRERRLEPRDVALDRVVLVATDTDPESGIVIGQHIELTESGTRLRPWRLCLATVEEIDELAAAAGLELRARYEDYTCRPFDPEESPAHVSVYRRGEGITPG